MASPIILRRSVNNFAKFGGFPGQPNNPVGYAAAPGYPGSLTTHATTGFTSGTSGSPQVYSFLDIDGDTGGTLLDTQDYITFIGCRFQSNSTGNYNVQINGATNIIFKYCSFVPRTTYYTTPPGSVWPSAGALDQTLIQINEVNCIDGIKGYQYGLNIVTGGPVTADHCDFWGFGNGGPLFYTTTANILINECWIHDPSFAGDIIETTSSPSTSSTTITIPTTQMTSAIVGYTVSGTGISGTPVVVSITDANNLVVDSAQTISSGTDLTFTVSTSLGSHIDGTGYINGGVGPSNVTVQNCTIAGIMNTNCLAWQGSTNSPDNINHIGNYISGAGYSVALNANTGTGVFTNSKFINNIFGTDLCCKYGFFYSDYSTAFGANGNVWKGNRIKCIPGTSMLSSVYPLVWTSSDHNKFVLPDSTLSDTDFS